ncbi:hypothetical protein [Peijinzhouia sedimentorum]
MSLDNFYKLRQNFIILGLTGKMQSGVDQVAELLSQKKLTKDQVEFLNNFRNTYTKISESESQKIRRIVDFFEFNGNWIQFDVVDYKKIIFLFILHHNYDSDVNKFNANICSWIIELGSYKPFITPRFGGNVGLYVDSTDFLSNKLSNVLIESLSKLRVVFKGKTLEGFLRILKSDKVDNIDFFFQNEFNDLADLFFATLDNYSPYLRHKLIHVASYCLRRFGTLDINVIKEDKPVEFLEHIYTIAEVINQLIKIHRGSATKDNNDKPAHIVIDRLKNSYELVYFREKYSGFYMVACNRNDHLRRELINKKIQNLEITTSKNENFKLLKALDEIEYNVDEFKDGIFDGYDVENCVQKADYHLVLKNFASLEDVHLWYKEGIQRLESKQLDRTNEYYIYQPFLIQVLKLISLIQQPGLFTPSYIERIMQVAFNAKLNSGCISRQVGAVLTDAHFSVKGIGWNDVPLGQTPCANRDIRDLVNGVEKGFTQFELGNTDIRYKDERSFNEKLREDFEKNKSNISDGLKGRSCSFCFKTFHNTYEAKDNQVHTRSLHAEENAMLQISKYGGQPLNGGNLFTTASPCELCSKKAYQLGVKNIFYIDNYPGISQNQILEGGKANPKIYQFQGAIGRGYFKLYEPFMSIKDETVIRSKIKPTSTEKERINQLKKILEKELGKSENQDLKIQLDKLKTEEKIMEKFVDIIRMGIKNYKVDQSNLED